MRREVPVKQAGERALIGDERGEPLGDLPIVRIEVPRHHGGNRLLLAVDVIAELSVDVGDQLGPNLLQPGLLGGDVGVVDSVQANPPRVLGKPIALRRGQIPEQGDALRTAVAHLGGNQVARMEDRDFELRAVNRVCHAEGYFTGRATSDRTLRPGEPPANRGCANHRMVGNFITVQIY